jgi:CTP synthase
VPIDYNAQGFDSQVCKFFGLPTEPAPDLSRWHGIVERATKPEGEVTIGVVGKYTSLLDSYKSLAEALVHGGLANHVRVRLRWFDSEIFEKEDAVSHLEDVHGILVPGGFGERGAEGKIAAATFARTRQIPYLGICFGMQMAVIECARNLAGLERASSSEFGYTEEPLVGLMTEWIRGEQLVKRSASGDLGGTMRLGAYKCHLIEGTKVREVYGTDEIQERHRHRYEVNINYREQLEAAGMRFSGMSPDGLLPEIVEYPDHPWFIGVQFHPELKSKPFEPHPLFTSFVAAAIAQSRLV